MIISRVPPALSFTASRKPLPAQEVEEPRDSVALGGQAASPAVDPLTVASGMAPGLYPLSKILEDLELHGAEFRTRRRWIPFFKVHRDLSAGEAAKLLEKRPEALQVKVGFQDWTALESPEEVRTLGALEGVAPSESPLVRALASLDQSLDSYRSLSRGESVEVNSWYLQDGEDACLAAYLMGDVSAAGLLERPEDAQFVKALAELGLGLGGDELHSYRALEADRTFIVSAGPVPVLAFEERKPDLLDRVRERKQFVESFDCEGKPQAMGWLLNQEDFEAWSGVVKGLVERGVRDPLAVCRGLTEPKLDELGIELDGELVKLAAPLAGERFTAGELNSVYRQLELAELAPDERQALARCAAPAEVVLELLSEGEERGKLLRGLAGLGSGAHWLSALTPAERREELLLHVGLEGADQAVKADLTGKLIELTGSEPEVNLDEGCQLNGRLATTEEVRALATRLRQEDEIPFDYIYDGCYARAHLMCRELGELGVNRAKMFVHGDLSASNQYQSVNWGWHVAPLVFVKGEDGEPEARIMDPSFTTEPLKPEDWISRFWRSGSLRVEIVVENQYMERPSYWPSADMDEDMPAVTEVMEEYSQILEEMRKA